MPTKARRSAAPPSTDSPFITRREAAALLRLNIQSVDELIRREKLPAFRPVGRRILIRKSDLLRVVTDSPVWGAEIQ